LVLNEAARFGEFQGCASGSMAFGTGPGPNNRIGGTA